MLKKDGTAKWSTVREAQSELEDISGQEREGSEGAVKDATGGMYIGA